MPRGPIIPHHVGTLKDKKISNLLNIILLIIFLGKNIISLCTFNIFFYISPYVTPTLNVSRKFSMCIIFSTGCIKIYNIKTSNEYYIQQYVFLHRVIQHYLSKHGKTLLNP